MKQTKKQIAYVEAMAAIRQLEDAASDAQKAADDALVPLRQKQQAARDAGHELRAAQDSANDRRNTISKDVARRLRARLRSRRVRRWTVAPTLHFRPDACHEDAEIVICVGVGRDRARDHGFREPESHMTQLVFHADPAGDLVAFLDRCTAAVVAVAGVVNPPEEEGQA